MKKFNLEVKLRELREASECGAYSPLPWSNSTDTIENKRFLLDVLCAMKDAERTINHLLGSDVVADEQLTALLWDSEAEQHQTELRQLQERCAYLEAENEDKGKDFVRILLERNDLKDALARAEKREKELLNKLQLAESKIKDLSK